MFCVTQIPAHTPADVSCHSTATHPGDFSQSPSHASTSVTLPALVLPDPLTHGPVGSLQVPPYRQRAARERFEHVVGDAIVWMGVGMNGAWPSNIEI
jgi:hypothetical protein